ncbi:unnamed protein product [Meganyctiphanes norvegica]|uniref:NADH dehydrogenase [ubiquinone] 1 alpha subcomplex subunit 5 n=1 Tax=Meganyctiphanes norvegica TaxID=48144 RepID=A0AAV2QD07_MEGNR
MAARKLTTGLTGLAVATAPHHTLGVLYGKTLRCLQKMPADAAYRRYTEQLTSERLAVVKTEPNVDALETKINCGQVEEVIQQAECELLLARKMLEWKPWEPLVEEAPRNQWKWPL